MAIQWMQRMREAGLTQAQAEAIAALPEERLVTRDYLDARLGELKNDLTSRLLGIVSLAIALVALVDKFVRP